MIGGAFGVLVALVGPFAAGWVKRLANGRVDSAKEQRQFYRDLQHRLKEVEAERDEMRARLTALENRLVMTEELANDLEELKQLVTAHLNDHPKVSQLLALCERMAIRMGGSGGAWAS